MSSVKNFQLCLAPQWEHAELLSPKLGIASQNYTPDEEDTPIVGRGSPNTPTAADNSDIILQFGKIDTDRFTMDVQYPLSVYQVC